MKKRSVHVVHEYFEEIFRLRLAKNVDCFITKARERSQVWGQQIWCDSKADGIGCKRPKSG